MSTNVTIEHYGPDGLISTETVVLTGEAELAYLGATKLRTAYATLRQWSTDAQTVVDGWGLVTTLQKDADIKELFRRFGILTDRLADLLQQLGHGD